MWKRLGKNTILTTHHPPPPPPPHSTPLPPDAAGCSPALSTAISTMPSALPPNRLPRNAMSAGVRFVSYWASCCVVLCLRSLAWALIEVGALVFGPRLTAQPIGLRDWGVSRGLRLWDRTLRRGGLLDWFLLLWTGVLQLNYLAFLAFFSVAFLTW